MNTAEHSSWAKLQDKFFHNQIRFEKALQKIEEAPSLEKKMNAALKAVQYARHTSTGYYSSDLIERVFIQAAAQHQLDLSGIPVEKGSILHVMSRAYPHGGHTRVVEHWVKNMDAAEDEQGAYRIKHSVLFTRQQKEIPPALLAGVQACDGQFIQLSQNLKDMEKALELRRIASRFELVVLHIHTDDHIPLLAFGGNDFRRPVFFLNHADHLFWLGMSISDKILDIRRWGQKITKNYRGREDSFILDIPMSGTRTADTSQNREKLGLPTDRKIIFSMGRSGKYKPLGDCNFQHIARRALEQEPDAVFVILGVENEAYWHDLGSRFILVPPKPYAKALEYLNCADLVWDSFPMSGGMALMDAVGKDKPVLSLECPTGQFNYVYDSRAYCQTEEELLEKTHSILHDKALAQEYARDVKQSIHNCNSVEEWRKRALAVYALRNTTHGIYDFTSKKNTEMSLLDSYLCSEYYSEKIKLTIPFLGSFIQVKDNGYKTILFRFNNNSEIKIKKYDYIGS